MTAQSNSKLQAGFAVVSLIIGLASMMSAARAQRMPEATRGPSVASRSPMVGTPGDYAGWQTCAGCHRAEAETYAKTPHAPPGEPLPTSPAIPAPGISPSAAAGKKIYDEMMCAGCHTISGQGGQGGGDLSDVGSRRTQAELLERMNRRRAGTVMPTLPPEMSNDKINNLVDYLLTLKGAAPAGAKPIAQLASVTGCETCHGPGKAHADSEQDAAGDAAKETAGAKLIYGFHGNPKENSARCMTCHTTSRQQENFSHSQHAAVGVSCNECHSSHLVRETKGSGKGIAFAQEAFYQVPQLPETVRWLHSSLLKQTEPNLCFSCHGNVQAQFALPVHHRVPEGLIKCSDCHNPHGSINRASLNATHWETCIKCHVEKRGPYVYEHPAVTVEGCVVCHNPHGSTNRMMLVRREGRQLCLQCHTGFHDQSGVPHSRLGFQASGECTRCHVTVHGSNLDPSLLR